MLTNCDDPLFSEESVKPTFSYEYSQKGKKTDLVEVYIPKFNKISPNISSLAKNYSNIE